MGYRFASPGASSITSEAIDRATRIIKAEPATAVALATILMCKAKIETPSVRETLERFIATFKVDCSNEHATRTCADILDRADEICRNIIQPTAPEYPNQRLQIFSLLLGHTYEEKCLSLIFFMSECEERVFNEGDAR